jgi:choline dehydrogenase-like flavoprotein
MKDVLDVLIIGSGAGGGPLALALAEAGLEILVLEKGREHQRSDYTADEIATFWRGMFVPSLADEPHILVHSGLAAPRPTQMGWIANCVGGGTAHMGGYFSRFHPDDFRMRSRFGSYGALADWPYSYQELEPYYSRAEWEIGVSGEAGSNPFEGSRSKPYPMPALDSHPLAGELDRVCRHRGLSPYPTPRSINSRSYQERPACSYCNFCAGYGCSTGARGSTQEALLSRARRSGRCELRALAMVREVTVGRDGRATGCIYIDESGAEHEVRSRVVCVCCSAVESARLLLLSKSPRFPDGLANRAGLVGRYLQFHATSRAQGRFLHGRHPEKPFSHPNPFIGRSLMDYYFLPPGVSDLPKGGLFVFSYSLGGPILKALTLAQRGPRTAWGHELKRRLQENRISRGLGFEVHHDFIPNEGTFVELDPEVRDKWGLPVARMHLDVDDHQKTAGRWLVDRGLEIIDEMGADELVAEAAGETASYLVHGTCRAGRDPATSALNEYCQAHEVSNLFVVDGSFMPTSGGAPPTLTILANSFRTADHIIERARAGDFS